MADRPPQRSNPVARSALLGVLFVAALAGCARTPESQQIKDTWEPLNRPVFGFNRGVDDHAVGPLARGWKKITPQVMRDGISNGYHNLTFPQRFVSSLGQGEPGVAGSELARFLVNSTIGLGGIFDPASKMGIEKHDESIGKMFASWGIPPGPYMVVPLLGPSTPRDALGGLLGVAMNPLMWVGVGVPGLGVLFAVNGRAQADDKIETAKRAALDYYVFARDAYVQSDGQGNWWDDSPIGAQPDDLYEVENWDAHPTTATATDLEVRIEAAEPGHTDAAQ